MRFRQHRYYVHESGSMIHTLVFANTTLYGQTLLAECSGENGDFTAVGTDSDDYAVGWTETTREEWLKRFSGDDEVVEEIIEECEVPSWCHESWSHECDGCSYIRREELDLPYCELGFWNDNF